MSSQYLPILQGQDYINIDDSTLPYIHLRVLGKGNSGFVEEVRDRLTNRVYARKTIPIQRYTSSDRATVFRNELAVIRGLESHHHMIKVFATYVTAHDFGLILQPVASDEDLHKYLVKYWKIADDVGLPDSALDGQRSVLRQAFGCLSAALAFMHEKKIRHRDVKPGNILVHNGTFLFTDFGYSFDFSGFNRSTTEGTPSFLTRRYSSPELAMREPRNSKSDVFSLGCVFIEVLAALRRDRGLDVPPGWGFMMKLEELHVRLEGMESEDLPEVLIKTIVRMTNRDPAKRLCSVHTAEAMLKLPAFCCRECAASPIATWKKRVEKDVCYYLSDESVEDYEWVSQ
jgi:serine/threonine protein kinase